MPGPRSLPPVPWLGPEHQAWPFPLLPGELSSASTLSLSLSFLVPPPVSRSVVPLPCSWRLAVGLLGLRPLFWPVSRGSRFLESGHWRRRVRVEAITRSVVNGGGGGAGCFVFRGGGRAAGAGGAVPQVREVLAGAAQLLRLRLRRMRHHSPRSLSSFAPSRSPFISPSLSCFC